MIAERAALPLEQAGDGNAPDARGRIVWQRPTLKTMSKVTFLDNPRTHHHPLTLYKVTGAIFQFAINADFHLKSR
jgi:hypothetical protein